MSFSKVSVFVVLCQIFVSCSQKTLRVVCIGDSITQGKAKNDSITELSYRYYLWEKLDSLGLDVDMVGSNVYWFNENKTKRIKLPVSRHTAHVFDPDHESWYGIKSGEVLNGGFTHDDILYAKTFEERLKNYKKPDIALIDIGGNDGEKDSLNANENIKRMVEYLFERNPKMDILLSKSNVPWDRYINHSVEKNIAIVKQKHPKMKIKYVDLASGWVNCVDAPGTHTFDWVHPNPAGQKVMADKWFKAYLSIQDTEKPIFKSEISVSNMSDSTATLDWLPATDNQFVAGYNLYVDNEPANYRYNDCVKSIKQCLALIPQNSYVLNDLKRDKIYKVVVEAVDYANNKSLPVAFSLRLK